MNRLGRQPHLCLITRGEANLTNFESEKIKIVGTVRDAVEDGVDLVQVREKNLPGRLLYDLACDVVASVQSTASIVVINDRPDIAIASGAHGVHLPETSLSPSVVREAFGDDLVIGVSTHDVEAAIRASQSGADFLFFGPVFETPGKGSPTGLDELRNVCRSVESFPVVALGGVDETNADQILATGAAGLAAIRSLNESESRRAICKAVEDFKAALG